MFNQSSKKRSGDLNRLTKSIIELVTGNPITEDISPIADKLKNSKGVKYERRARQKNNTEEAKSFLKNTRK